MARSNIATSIFNPTSIHIEKSHSICVVKFFRRLLICISTFGLMTVIGCSNEVIDKSTVEYVRERSTITSIPETAKGIRFLDASGRDRYEYLYFTDSRASVDKFSNGVLGFVPTGTSKITLRPNNIDRKWWFKSYPPGSRGGLQNADGKGAREVLIVDRDSYSEVWMFKGS